MKIFTIACFCIFSTIVCKAIEKEMKIEAVYLAEKSGGKSGHLISKYEEATAQPKIR